MALLHLRIQTSLLEPYGLIRNSVYFYLCLILTVTGAGEWIPSCPPHITALLFSSLQNQIQRLRGYAKFLISSELCMLIALFDLGKNIFPGTLPFVLIMPRLSK